MNQKMRCKVYQLIFRFYQIPLSSDEKSKFYSKPDIKKFVVKIGLIEDDGKYSMDVESKTKVEKIMKWINKGVKKVKKIDSKSKTNDELADGFLNDEIDIDEMAKAL